MRTAGQSGSEDVGISSDIACEIHARRKPKVSLSKVNLLRVSRS